VVKYFAGVLIDENRTHFLSKTQKALWFVALAELLFDGFRSKEAINQDHQERSGNVANLEPNEAGISELLNAES